MTPNQPDWFDPSPHTEAVEEAAPLGFGVISDTIAAADLIAAIPGLGVTAQAPATGNQWAAIIDPGRIEALLIDAAPPARAAMVQDALAVGVPVMSRGTPATDPADMDTIKRLSGLSDGLVMGWFPLLFEPGIAALRELGEMIGPLRGLGLRCCGREGLSDRDLIFETAADAVALCLDIMGSKPTWQGAEHTADGTLSLRLLFAGDIAARIDLPARPDAGPDTVTTFRDAVTMRWTTDQGLSLHPPVLGTLDLMPPAGPGEAVETPDPGGPDMAIRTFAHMVMEGAPQPQMLDFAADVTAVLAACAKSLSKP